MNYSGAFTKSEFQIRAAAVTAREPETDSFRAFVRNRKPKDNRPFKPHIITKRTMYIIIKLLFYSRPYPGDRRITRMLRIIEYSTHSPLADHVSFSTDVYGRFPCPEVIKNHIDHNIMFYVLYFYRMQRQDRKPVQTAVRASFTRT